MIVFIQTNRVHLPVIPTRAPKTPFTDASTSILPFVWINDITKEIRPPPNDEIIVVQVALAAYRHWFPVTPKVL